MAAVELKWGGMPHSLTFEETDNGVVGIFKIEKKKGVQTIPILVPDDVTIEMITTAWELQGKKWDELLVYSSHVYVADRAIWLENGMCLLWHVIHILDVPHDLCNFVDFNKNDWPHSLRLVHMTSDEKP